MVRDKGRFSNKGEDGLKITFDVPSIRRIIFWIIISAALLPWISIISKFEVLKKILDLFDELMNPSINENGNSKKSGLFS